MKGKKSFCLIFILIVTASVFVLEFMPLVSANSIDHGFVHVSSRDPHYFEFDDGTPFFPIGINKGWILNNDSNRGDGYTGSGDHTHIGWTAERYFQEMRAHNMNYVRIWMCSWHINIEKNLGVYDESECEKLDYILELCDEYDIYVQLCLLTFTDFSKLHGNHWDLNPYNKANGGPCNLPVDFLTNETAKYYIKKRFNYILGRWGDNPRIAMWEFWNEVDLVGRSVDPYVAPTDAVSKAWHEDVAQVFRENDTHCRPLTTSCCGDVFWDLTFLSDAIDVIQIHTYRTSDPVKLAGYVSGYIKRYLTPVDRRKPVMIGEYGTWNQPSNEPEHCSNGVWAAVASGGGCSLRWASNVGDGCGDMTDAMFDRYFYFQKFVQDIQWTALNLSQGTGTISNASNTRVFNIQGDAFAIGWVQHTTSGTVSGAKLTFSNLVSDNYSVYIYDDSTGTYLNVYGVTVSNGSLTIDLPDFVTHLAVKVVGTTSALAPVAVFTYSPYVPVVNETMTFDASASLPGWNGTHLTPILSYQWDFGDGNTNVTSSPIVTHEYTEADTYTVVLNVTDGQGFWNTTSKQITTHVPFHDVAVINVTPMCYQAYTTWGEAGGSSINPITVTVKNNGTFSETFIVSAGYTNASGITVIGTQGVTLDANQTTTLTFNWAAGVGSGMAVGCYDISANASTVANETYTANNQLTDGVVKICFGGDANGDGWIIGFDATIVSINWWKDVPPCHIADFNNDGWVKGYDATVVSINWWQRVPKPPC